MLKREGIPLPYFFVSLTSYSNLSSSDRIHLSLFSTEKYSVPSFLSTTKLPHLVTNDGSNSLTLLFGCMA